MAYIRYKYLHIYICISTNLNVICISFSSAIHSFLHEWKMVRRNVHNCGCISSEPNIYIQFGEFLSI